MSTHRTHGLLTTPLRSQDGDAANGDPAVKSKPAVKSEQDVASTDAVAEALKAANVVATADPCPEIEAGSEFLGRNIARLVKNGGWEEGLVVCDDGTKGLVVKFGRGQEHHPVSAVCFQIYLWTEK